MARVLVQANTEERDCRAALGRVANYRNWPGASDTIRSVEVQEDGDGTSVSRWEVTFRGGLMRWSERDRLDLDGLEHSFKLIEGDPHGFAGTWRAEPTENGCLLTMDAQFDLGMPSLSHVLDPIAVEALEDAVADVVQSLFGDSVDVAFGAAASI
jgi:Polyketide cyclase / dehydrase and lipid transport